MNNEDTKKIAEQNLAENQLAENQVEIQKNLEINNQTPVVLNVAEKGISSKNMVLPFIPMRDIIVFPGMVIPLFLARAKSLGALEYAKANNTQMFLVLQKDSKLDTPTKNKDLYQMGVVANVLQVISLPDGASKVLFGCVARAKMVSFKENEQAYLAEVDTNVHEFLDKKDQKKAEGLKRSVINKFEDYVRDNPRLSEEVFLSLSGLDDLSKIADIITINLEVDVVSKQRALEELDLFRRLRLVNSFLIHEIYLISLETKIDTQLKAQIEKGQKEYYLNEKIKVIKKELGEAESERDRLEKEIENLKNKIKKAKMSKKAQDAAYDELGKLKLMPYMSAEGTVSRNYIDALVSLPWNRLSKNDISLEKAKEILEEDHYGLEKVKDRILEYIAVSKRAKKLKGPILCLIGPPGVGKTSLGKSIARATGREFARISLGGVRDEAEIRGHRRTYVGAMPGGIIQKLSKLKTNNPLIMLDEIDKMASDYHGDPAAALLEVLDPEQNSTFNDHYLEVDYDLSNIMFITTANSYDIPDALLDRMEIINIEGYIESEKINIAKNFLIKKELEANVLTSDEIEFTDGAIIDIIRYYTREAGVRFLEQTIAKICRKVVKEILLSKLPKKEKIVITSDNLEKYLGVRRFKFGLIEEQDQVGQVNGLAWTEVGGDLLQIEVAIVKGKGNAIYTGSLGDVMLESIQAAITVVRSLSDELNLPANFYTKNDIHVHAPEGATPKDGPSAGISMCTAIVSAFTKIAVRRDIAMTGEITLRGEVLPIGGLKEKLLAAARGGIKTVIIPLENEKDLKEIPHEVLDLLEIKPVRWIKDVLKIALTQDPFNRPKRKKTTLTKKTKKEVRKGKANPKQK